MAKVVARRVIPGSQERVWHLLSNFERMNEWLPDVLSVEHTGGPPKGMGREQTAQMNGGIQAHHRLVAWDHPDSDLVGRGSTWTNSVIW